MNKLINDTEGHFTGMMWRDGLKSGYNLFHGLKDFYVDWVKKMGETMHAGLIMRWLQCSTLLIAPICPHFAETAWEMLGQEGSVLKAMWPSPNGAVDAKVEGEREFHSSKLKIRRPYETLFNLTS